MIEAVHHYEGTVNRVMGDGIMALFGAPLAHEDHAVRACYAALRMQDTIARYADERQHSDGVPVTIRIGINSGEILVSGIGRDLHMDYIVVGHTVHLAARMEQMATAGSVFMTDNTLRLAEGYITVTPLGPLPVKGLSDPIRVYEMTGGGPARTRLQGAALRGLTRFVGRDNEMKLLHQSLERTRIAQSQVVAVVGPPGVGKSRLIHEFIRSSDATDCLTLESGSVSYGRATPYLPVRQLLRDYFKISDGDSTQSIGEKVASKTLALDTSLHDALPPLMDLLDALPDEHPFRSLDPIQHQQRTYQAVTRLLLNETRTQPVIVLFEDLHWNDSLTLGLLSEIAVSASDARLLLVVSYRPEFRDEWSSRPNYRQVRLEPLTGESVAVLLQALLGSDSSLSTLNSLVVERTGGNPFFVEEIVRSLEDMGVLEGTRGSQRLVRQFSGIEVPPTVQAVLSARIDALPATQKRVLQEAAVIGFNVSYALLHAICGLADENLRSILSDLHEADFLYTTQLFPDLQYTFKHSLTHDVVYAGLLHERRRDIHARIVNVIDRFYADRLGEQIERLADHALRGHLWEIAIGYLRQAGAKAADRGAYREAAGFFEQALTAQSELPESRGVLELAVDIRFELRNVLQPLGDRERIADNLGEAEVLASRLDDTRRTGWVHAYLTDHFWILGRYKEAVLAGEKAIAIAERLSDLPLRVVTNLPLGLAHHTLGDYHRSIQHFRWNSTCLEGELVQERFGMFVLPSSFSLSFMAWAYAEMGDFSEASAVGAQALRIAEAVEHPFSCGYAHLGLGVLSLRKGDFAAALQSFEHAMAADGFADSPVGYAYVGFHLGYALTLSGQPTEGIEIIEQTVRLAESKNFIARHALRLAYLSEAYLIAGRVFDATTMGLRALEFAREHDERANQAYALRVLGEVEAHHGKTVEAEIRFREALLLSEELGMRPLQAHCHRGIADVLEATHLSSTAVVHRNLSTALIDATQMRFWRT
jgi:tetratricopeptide (TPR) repeat protein